MITTHLQPDQIRDAFGRIIDEEIHCEQRENMILLDTPYLTGRGYSLRAFISVNEHGIVVSDGGFTVSQIETFAPNPKSLSHRYTALAHIAQRLGIIWGEGEFCYTEETLDAAMQRLKMLAQAVQEGLELIRPRVAQDEQWLLTRLTDTARLRHLAVRENVRILIPDQARQLRIDLEIESDEKKAAVDLVMPRTDSGAISVINRMITDFHAISRTHQYEWLIGVYDEQGLFADRKYRQRFDGSKPDKTLLLPSETAIADIQSLLAA